MNPEQKHKKGGARLLKPSSKKAETAPEKETEAVPAKKPEFTDGDAAAGQKAKKPKPQRTTKQKVLRGVFIGVTVLAAIIVAIGIALAIFIQKPPQVTQPDRNSREPSGTEAQDDEAAGSTARPDGVSSDRKEDFYTFLVVGRDTYGGGNTDTIMLASYDIPNQKLSVMSIPRDTLVNVSWDIKKINSVYNMYGGGDEGMDALKDEVSQLVGFIPDYTFVVEWEAVGKLVDAIGGVYFDVPRRMYYNDLSQNFKIDLQEGYQLIDGDKAMQLLRWRHNSDDNGNILNSGYANGDLGRIETQQAFLQAAIEQCLQKITEVDTITGIAQIFFENVTTELSVGNLAWFAQQAIFGNSAGEKLDMANVNFVTMPWVSADGVWSRTYNNHPSYVAPDVDELVNVVNEYFNPYVDDLRQDELDIMYVNDDGTLGCTSGVLEDTKYNSWVRNKNSSSSGSGTSSTAPSSSTSPSPSASASETPSTNPSPGATETPAPSPSGSTTPTPTPSDTQPAVSETPAPSPSESTSPSPTPSETQPAVSETPVPSPSATETPSPSPSESGGADQPPEGIPIYTPEVPAETIPAA